jgi:hypothetical protein
VRGGLSVDEIWDNSLLLSFMHLFEKGHEPRLLTKVYDHQSVAPAKTCVINLDNYLTMKGCDTFTTALMLILKTFPTYYPRFESLKKLRIRVKLDADVDIYDAEVQVSFSNLQELEFEFKKVREFMPKFASSLIEASSSTLRSLHYGKFLPCIGKCKKLEKLTGLRR